MPTDRDRERAPWDMAAGAGPPEDWLAIVIRKALQSSVNNAEPPPTIWVQIRQNIEAMGPSLAQEEDPMLSDRDFLVHLIDAPQCDYGGASSVPYHQNHRPLQADADDGLGSISVRSGFCCPGVCWHSPGNCI